MGDAKKEVTVKKAGVKMPKSIKRMLALMGEEDRKKCHAVLYSAVQAEHHNRIQMLRRRSSEKDDNGD
jgi:hypothetical protein